ncbi:MAG TPA: NAD(P)-binding domain-containing protein [Candidatus Udaeobacter sp.]|nr:NAD(P)-binding domain-containing protein [Candidatus Udaeobacter sp.]
MTRSGSDVIVVGAGPYGLASAAHLAGAGANVRVFGSPMSFWMQQMPKGMLLRSPWGASHISDPRSALTLDAFERGKGTPLSRPVPLSDFIAYGHWFQQHAVPEVDPRRVERIDAVADGLQVTLEDGESLDARRVVVAGGIAPFVFRPAEFAALPPELATHSSDHADLASFAGRRVAVVGGGQSAFECAVLLYEAGAEVELLMRASRIRWVGRATRKGLLGRLMFHRTDVGPAFVSHLVARPRILRWQPRVVQREALRRALQPGASLWLRPRSQGMPISSGRRITSVARVNGHVRLGLDDATSRDVEHVLLATGYRVDVRRYPFLSPSVAASVRTAEGYPVLRNGLESSVPGLHFVGAPAAGTFGPLVRFVSGTEFAARAVTRSIVGRHAGATDRDDLGFEYRSAERQA